jgi:hypothetical protein
VVYACAHSARVFHDFFSSVINRSGRSLIRRTRIHNRRLISNVCAWSPYYIELDRDRITFACLREYNVSRTGTPYYRFGSPPSCKTNINYLRLINVRVSPRRRKQNLGHTHARNSFLRFSSDPLVIYKIIYFRSFAVVLGVSIGTQYARGHDFNTNHRRRFRALKQVLYVVFFFYFYYCNSKFFSIRFSSASATVDAFQRRLN